MTVWAGEGRLSDAAARARDTGSAALASAIETMKARSGVGQLRARSTGFME